ncbi:PIN domain-containing protein [Rhodoferax sp.]|uniref:type II toxin-antitoxin system VapC family toxin n=1 Tax=Rhodoferax sp. TaxID=50421 RepID=UPI0019DDF35F|nr:PIN domain-containing protein [Rhodoferax sp.]MBE0473693.1 PIN domain-containing protein [Rhodoferax sp.]
MILVDSCVLIDVFDADPQWQQWSLDALQTHHAQGLAVNALVCAEIAPSFASQQQMQEALDLVHLVYAPLSQACAFVAAQAFALYRQNKGSKLTTLPDFFIGAHAQTQGWPILTRDKARYKTYFPAVKLITPNTFG